MKLTINDQRKISSIQKAFNDLFPYLKLEFFSKPHRPGHASAKRLMQHHLTIGQCRTQHSSGALTITPVMTVADLEQTFSDLYGLSVQVFRRSGNIWLETTITDSWTLQEQNEQGEALTLQVAERQREALN